MGAIYARRVSAERPAEVHAWQLMATALVTWYSWVAFTPLVERLADRWPLRGPSAARRAVVHVACAIGFAFLQAVATAVASGLVGLTAWRDVPGLAPEWFIVLLPAGMVIYGAVVLFRVGTVHRVRLEQRERQAEQLALQLRDAQLTALRGQLQPHFLFNTLTAITALVRDHETARATEALEQLGALLRSALRADDRHEVPLGEELARVRDYLRIEELRLGREIRVTVDAPDAALRALVPAWILQPVVENAVRHGFRGRPDAGALAIRADLTDARLTLAIADDGAGLAADWERRVALGHGVSNSRARLAALHGAGAAVTLAPNAPSGTVVTIALPSREGAA